MAEPCLSRNIPTPTTHSQETLNEMVFMFRQQGFQVAFHAVGDKAVDMALNAIEYAMNKDPTPEALERIKNLGVIISSRPRLSGYPCSRASQYEGKASEAQMTRFMPRKEILDHGITLAFGCDVPATPLIEPNRALIGATTRWTLDNKAIAAEQCISMKDAVRAHTMGSAYAAFEENVRGSLEPGKRADMVVWSHDLYNATLKELTNTRAEITIVEGAVLFTAQDTDITFHA